MSKVTVVESNEVPNFFSFTDADGNNVAVDVRIEGDEVLFRASDVAKCLGYSEPSNFMKLLGIDNLPLRKVTVADGRVRQVPFITEKQLYKGVLKSCAPNAEPFQDWVCGIVLPTIRKTGSFSMAAQPTPDPHAGLSPEVRAIFFLDSKLQEVEAKLAVFEEKVVAEAEATRAHISNELTAKADAADECLSAKQIETLESLWHNECYLKFKDKRAGGKAVGTIKGMLKRRFLAQPASCTYKDIAQRNFAVCVSFSKELIAEALAKVTAEK